MRWLPRRGSHASAAKVAVTFAQELRLLQALVEVSQVMLEVKLKELEPLKLKQELLLLM